MKIEIPISFNILLFASGKSTKILCPNELIIPNAINIIPYLYSKGKSLSALFYGQVAIKTTVTNHEKRVNGFPVHNCIQHCPKNKKKIKRWNGDNPYHHK